MRRIFQLDCLLLLAGLVLGLQGTGTALAQGGGAAATGTDTAETDRARSLFAEGVELVAESQFPEAEARFRQALAIRDAPAIRYNLASVLYEQGHYPEAQVENERALASEGVPPAVRTASEELRQHIAERAAYVQFELQGGATGGTITVDGYVLTQPALEIPLSPAPHEVSVSIRGEVVVQRTVELATGEHRVIPMGSDVEPPEDPAGSSGGRSIDQEDWFWPVVGGGGAAIIVIVAVSVGIAAGSGTEGPVEGNFMPGVIRWP